MNRKIVGGVTFLILAVLIGLQWYKLEPKGKVINEVEFSCAGNKNIQAIFYDRQVDLSLSDKRQILLPQTISASGARYANADESFVFWTKGNTAFVTEQGKETFSNCLLNGELSPRDQAVEEFLLSQTEFSWETQPGSQRFCVWENLQPESDLFPLYLWVRCGEFVQTDGKIKESSGMSAPVKIDYPNELSYFDQRKFRYQKPGDGSLYDRDVEKIFPAEILPRLNHDGSALNKTIKEKAQAYFSST